MRIRLARVALLLLPLVFAAAPCVADIYSFVDEHGITHFTDVASDSRATLFMKSAPPAAASDAPAVPNAASAGTLPKPYGEAILRIAREHGLEPALLHAVITVESGYNPVRTRARAPAGSCSSSRRRRGASA
jgi:soluble lytic murein transglycosylase-like protein